MRSMDEVYGSLAYDGAPLLRFPVCVSRALLVIHITLVLFSLGSRHWVRWNMERSFDGQLCQK